LVYFMAIWYILWLFGIFFPVLVCWTNKNLATLLVVTVELIFLNKRRCEPAISRIFSYP
jgi:hypothetical protein